MLPTESWKDIHKENLGNPSKQKGVKP